MPITRRLLAALPVRTPLPPPRARGTARSIVWIYALPFALLYMLLTVASAWPGAQRAASGATTAAATASDPAVMRGAALWLLLSVPVWLLLGMAERAPSVGLKRMAPRQLAAASCAVFCLAEAPMFLLGTAFEVLRAHSPAVAAHSGSNAGSTLLGGVFASVAAGVSEEIVVLVLPALAVWRFAPRATGARQRRLGTAALLLVLVAARLSYHLEYGLAIVSLVPWSAVSVLLYLRTRAILPLMIAHAAYDIALIPVNRVGAQHGFAAATALFAALAALVLAGALLAGRTPRRVAAVPGEGGACGGGVPAAVDTDSPIDRVPLPARTRPAGPEHSEPLSS
ncbi:type II CAAX prenyl endopeptidase Rce1 family protein [Kitasatospora sp. NPDC088134]|uniref:CPBP family glutamic-type intramembrane protease n=1 Tax=Kitasatospora sp. NPDC088134 TaxID=3364071 RepID=UPI0037F61193